MADTSQNKDPNEELERRGPDHPNLSPADQWGEKLNPVRETPDPFGSLRDAGGGSSS